MATLDNEVVLLGGEGLDGAPIFERHLDVRRRELDPSLCPESPARAPGSRPWRRFP